MKDIEKLEYVNANSKYVSINKKEIDSFLGNIKNWNYHYWLSEVNLNLTEKEFIIFAFICETMNFCFWDNRDWIVNYENNNYHGSEALFYAMIKEVNKNKQFLNINYLSTINRTEFKKILIANDQLPPMISKRYKMFKETINIIKLKGEGFFTELFSINTDEELLKYIIKNFKHFNDKSKFKDKTIHFNKRAILLVNDLFHLSEQIKMNIKTINNLNGGADYAIPRLFKEVGIFQYDNKLLKKIANQKNIRHNSQMEVEIRSNALYVLELMREKLCEQNIKLTSIELDNIVWQMKKEISGTLPVHHTRTIYY